jgi:Spy/CpxP family protein refolding chaperone
MSAKHRMLAWVAAAIAAAIVVAPAIGAQTPESTTVRPFGRAGRVGGRGQGGARADKLGRGNQQQALAREVRARFLQRVGKQLNLNDDQSRQLAQIDDKYTRQRNQVGRDERNARLGLKTALQDTATAGDQSKIEQALNSLVQAQHRRADLLESEQKELSGFLNPRQRAQYVALQQQLQQAIAQVRRQNGGGRGGAPPEP